MSACTHVLIYRQLAREKIAAYHSDDSRNTSHLLTRFMTVGSERASSACRRNA